VGQKRRTAKSRAIDSESAEGGHVHASHASHVARRGRDVCSDWQTATRGAISRSRGEDGNYSVFRDDPHFKAMHTYVPFQRLLAKIKKETESYRREFGKT
jgi:hypothetical protein